MSRVKKSSVRSALLCRQRGSCHSVFRGFQILVLCVSGISQGRSCRDPGLVDAKELNDAGIWQIHPVSTSDFKGLERRWFLCNVGIGFLWKGLGSHQNSSAGYSLVFFLDKVKVAKLKTPFSSHECQANVSRSSIPSAQILKKVVYLLMERKRFWWISIRATRRRFASVLAWGRSFQEKIRSSKSAFLLLKWCFEVGVDFINRDPRWLYSAWAVWFVLIII